MTGAKAAKKSSSLKAGAAGAPPAVDLGRIGGPPSEGPLAIWGPLGGRPGRPGLGRPEAPPPDWVGDLQCVGEGARKGGVGGRAAHIMIRLGASCTRLATATDIAGPARQVVLQGLKLPSPQLSRCQPPGQHAATHLLPLSRCEKLPPVGPAAAPGPGRPSFSLLAASFSSPPVGPADAAPPSLDWVSCSRIIPAGVCNNNLIWLCIVMGILLYCCYWCDYWCYGYYNVNTTIDNPYHAGVLQRANGVSWQCRRAVRGAVSSEGSLTAHSCRVCKAAPVQHTSRLAPAPPFCT
jgi:hypothetical protein